MVIKHNYHTIITLSLHTAPLTRNPQAKLDAESSSQLGPSTSFKLDELRVRAIDVQVNLRGL